ncbi:508_t:CDS:2, partial [Racocetra persica]
FWTNSYPLELDLWHETDGYDLEKKTTDYLHKRQNEIKLSHQIFRKSLSSDELKSLNECVISMIFKSTIPDRTFDMNRQFMYVFDKEDATIIDSHSNHPLNELRDIVSAVFNKKEYSNDTKAKLYIKMLLEYTKTVEFNI